MSDEILAQARKRTAAADIVDDLLALEKIFGADLPANAAFRTELIGKFVELARNPAVDTAAQIQA
jgi:PREDICTED: d-mannonate oxidoreductase-like